MKYIVSINDKNYEVEVERGQAKIIKTTQAIQMEIQTEVSKAATTVPVQVTAQNNINIADGEPIKSPMPGTILAVKASAGAAVKRGEPLFILEAMKMENEIVAPRDGVLSQVVIAKGASVATGDVLGVLK